MVDMGKGGKCPGEINLESMEVIGQPHMGSGEENRDSSDLVKQLAIQQPHFEITGSALQSTISYLHRIDPFYGMHF